MYTCGCSIFLTEGPFGKVTIVTTHGPNHCFTDQCNVERNFTGYGSWLGFHYLIPDQCIVMRKMECCFLVWVSSTSFQTLLDIGEDGCCLLVWAFTTCLQAFAGYWGRCMLFSFSGSMLPAFRPCWMSGETSAVSLSGPLLPARGAYCRKLREMYAVLLVWVWASTTCFQAFAGCWGR